MTGVIAKRALGRRGSLALVCAVAIASAPAVAAAADPAPSRQAIENWHRGRTEEIGRDYMRILGPALGGTVVAAGVLFVGASVPVVATTALAVFTVLGTVTFVGSVAMHWQLFKLHREKARRHEGLNVDRAATTAAGGEPGRSQPRPGATGAGMRR